MWIHHIGEIMIGVFALLIVAHFALHVIFKRQRHHEDKKMAEERSKQKAESEQQDH